MKPLLILYATRQGQTRRIAEHIQAAIRDRGHTARLRNLREIREPFSLERYDGAILAASVHIGRHEPELVHFVKRHREELDKVPTAFLSVSLSEAGAEDPSRSEADRAKATADVQRTIHAFLDRTGWRPRRVRAVAGALLYSKYNFFVRFVMKQVAKRSAMGTDTSQDHEFTDWTAVDRFVDDVLSDHAAHTTARDAPRARAPA